MQPLLGNRSPGLISRASSMASGRAPSSLPLCLGRFGEEDRTEAADVVRDATMARETQRLKPSKPQFEQRGPGRVH